MLRVIMVVCVGVSAVAGISRSELAARMRGWVSRCMRLDAERDYGGVHGGQTCALPISLILAANSLLLMPAAALTPTHTTMITLSI